MMTRFLQTSVLALSSFLFGSACSRVAETNDVPVSSSASSEPLTSPTLPDPSRQWEGLISGNPDLPSSVATLLRSGADEEALAANPRVHLEEGVASTVSRARHQRRALEHYRQALELLTNDSPTVQKRIRQKMAVLSLSLESLDDVNGRLFPPR